MAGKLIFYYGTVSSSKTMQLLSVGFNYEQCGWKVCTIKPALDTRSVLIETRAQLPSRQADIVVNNEDSIYDYSNEVNEADVILVDECQFLSTNHIDELRNIAVDRDIDVLCFGLRTDFNAHLFPASKRLFDLADDLIEVKTICNTCGKHASFNKRVTQNDDSGVIDPSWNNYKPSCFRCYRE